MHTTKYRKREFKKFIKIFLLFSTCEQENVSLLYVPVRK